MKVAVIMRGIPGSGKSTVATLLKNKWGASIHSTDSYHIHNDVYTYDKNKAADYHQENHTAFMTSCAKEVPIVVVDNTNLWPNFYEPLWV
jgi:tRNA uridine 5-carbamoylmethylation protein Kti12